jgi:hypothetical protein
MDETEKNMVKLIGTFLQLSLRNAPERESGIYNCVLQIPI